MMYLRVYGYSNRIFRHPRVIFLKNPFGLKAQGVLNYGDVGHFLVLAFSFRLQALALKFGVQDFGPVERV